MGPEGAGDWGDLTIDFASFPPHNLAPLLKGQPEDRCQRPHWGYLFKGKIVVHYADHEEVIEAGQAFYLPPEHVPEALESCELLQFSPTSPRLEVVQAMGRNAQAMAPGGGAPSSRREAVEILRQNVEEA
jgi:hypothetical protein